MRFRPLNYAAALLAFASWVAACPAFAVIIDSVDGEGNVSAPSSPAGITHGFESGYANVQAKRSGDQAVVWQGTLSLDGAFLAFDPNGTPTQFGSGTIEDFSLLVPMDGPFALLQAYGVHDEMTIESVVLKPAAGFATSVGFPIGPDRWSVTAGPIEITATYSAVDTGGSQPPVSDVIAPLATATLVGTVELLNGQLESRLTCAVTATLDGSFFGAPNLTITGDFTWLGSVAAAIPDPGWEYVGTRGNLTAVYLGDGFVLTANHVGAGDFVLGGVTYPFVPGSDVRLKNNDQSLADMLVFKVSPDPGLPPLPLRTAFPSVGADAILIGNGRERGLTTSFDPGAPDPPIGGWEWAPGTTLRWGTNKVDGFPSGKILGNVAVFTAFDPDDSVHEAQAANGDSGGALFVERNGTWELAGILYAVGAFPQQPSETAIYGNVTYAARVDYYYDEIQDAIALPEPSRALGLLMGTALLRVLGHRRSRNGTARS
jgi:hypothetical protein